MVVMARHTYSEDMVMLLTNFEVRTVYEIAHWHAWLINAAVTEIKKFDSCHVID